MLPPKRNKNSSKMQSHMYQSHSKWFWTFILLGLLVVHTNAVEEKKSTDTVSWDGACGHCGLYDGSEELCKQKTVQPSPASPSSTSTSSFATHRDEIYIDDEEGSGGHGSIHDDLEKDPDYSGSGFGPDDEDGSPDLHPPKRPSYHNPPNGNSNTNKANTNDNDLITSRTNHESNSGTIIGSGTNYNSNNNGFIGASAGNSNTGTNTIGKDHSLSKLPNQSSATTTTTSTQDSPTSSIQKTTSSSNNKPSLSSTPISSSSSSSTTTTFNSHTPSNQNHLITNHNNDDDDFDLDGTLPDGSGDGTIYDHGETEDDDKTGDDNIDDNDPSIITTSNNPDLGSKVVVHKADGDTITFDSTNNEDKNTEIYDDDEDDEDTLDLDNHNIPDGEDDAHVTDPNLSNAPDRDATPKQPGITNINSNSNNQGNIHELDTNNINSLPPETKETEQTTGGDVFIMDTKADDRTTSFFAQPGILAAVIGGAVVGLLCAILVVMFIVYRMRKKDEGSYALDEPKRSPAVNSYAKNANNREFYA